MKVKRTPLCHPERKYFAKGFCQPCYFADYFQNNSEYRKNQYAGKARRRRLKPNFGKITRRKTDEQIEKRKSDYQRVRLYNLSPEQAEELLKKQEGLCPICKKLLLNKGAHVDHDHSCCPGGTSCGKCVRGLLHGNCNSFILRVVETNEQEI